MAESIDVFISHHTSSCLKLENEMASNRIKQGWKYGVKRDDIKKKHPCLIEYEKLSEEEKEYDRITAFETLKLIKKLGYKIIQ